MQTIAIVQTTTLTIEFKAREIQETFNVLEDHNIKVCNIAFTYYSVLLLIYNFIYLV